MNVKRFVAPDMRQALSRVSRELGAEAVVLSSRSLPEGGVEVLATQTEASGNTAGVLAGTGSAGSDQVANPGGSPSRDDFRSQLLRRQLDNLRASSDRQGLAAGSDTMRSGDRRPEKSPMMQDFNRASREVGQMRSELNSLRSLLQQRLGAVAWDDFNHRTPVQASVWERLSGLGIPGHLIRDILERVRPEYNADQAWRFSLAYLNRAIPVTDADIVANGGIFALLGPTGVGKTTTIGKLATRQVLAHGADSVALVTTDSHRIAAHEQLKTLGGILGVGVHVVDQRKNLSDTLDGLAHKSLVLIDTAGMHPSDPALQQQLDSLAADSRVRKLMVLACTSQSRVLSTAYRSYSRAGLDACVLSKLDEAGTLGEALALVIDRRLPVAYESFGQGIPDDLDTAQSKSLLRRAIKVADVEDEEHEPADRERLVAEFSQAATRDSSQNNTGVKVALAR